MTTSILTELIVVFNYLLILLLFMAKVEVGTYNVLTLLKEWRNYFAIRKVAKQFRRELCMTNVPLPTIVIEDIPNDDGWQVNGYFSFNKWKIAINSEWIKQKGGVSYDVESTVIHEMRHAWQWLNYPKTCTWWAAHPQITNMFYGSVTCVTEADARLYGDSHGDDIRGMFLLDDFEENFEQRTEEVINKYIQAKLQESSRE